MSDHVLSEHALFWFLFPRVVEMALCAVGISATTFLAIKSPAARLGEKS